MNLSTSRVNERNARITARLQAQGWNTISEYLTAIANLQIKVTPPPPEVVANRKPKRQVENARANQAPDPRPEPIEPNRG